MTTYGFGLLAGAALGGLFVVAPQFHFAEDPLALHLLFEDSQSLVDVVVANEDLHGRFSPSLGHTKADRFVGHHLRQNLAPRARL